MKLYFIKNIIYDFSVHLQNVKSLRDMLKNGSGTCFHFIFALKEIYFCEPSAYPKLVQVMQYSLLDNVMLIVCKLT